VAGKPLFAPVPLRAMCADMSGLQLRVLVCVAAHDRLSLITGKGQGCRASNDRMSKMIGCSFARLCSTLSQLVDRGLLKREKLGKHTVYRVLYTDADELLFGNLSERATGCRVGSKERAMGCHDFSETRRKPRKTASQYIPLNGGIDSDESGEEISSEDAHLAMRGLGGEVQSPNYGAELARFERALNEAPGDLSLSAWSPWLERLIEHSDDPTITSWASRLLDRIDSCDAGDPISPAHVKAMVAHAASLRRVAE